MARFKCVKQCYHNNRMWYPGGRFLYADKAPKHFKKMDEPKAKNSDEPLSEKERLVEIKAALSLLDKKDDKMWTKTELPQVREVEKLIGFDTNRNEIEEAWPGFGRIVQPLQTAETTNPLS